jgi:hypothetical protein
MLDTRGERSWYWRWKGTKEEGKRQYHRNRFTQLLQKVRCSQDGSVEFRLEGFRFDCQKEVCKRVCFWKGENQHVITVLHFKDISGFKVCRVKIHLAQDLEILELSRDQVGTGSI